MSKQVSDTWQQLDGLDPDTAQAAGWWADSIEWSPSLGSRMDLWNPKGQLVAWGWSPSRLNVADMVRASQAAYAKVRAS